MLVYWREIYAIYDRQQACVLLPKGHLPYAGSVTACMCIPLIELLSWSVRRRVPVPEYMLSGVPEYMLSGLGALAFVR
jgi:hypothetical protein